MKADDQNDQTCHQQSLQRWAIAYPEQQNDASPVTSPLESCERRVDVLELKIFCEMYRVDLVAFLKRAGVVA